MTDAREAGKATALIVLNLDRFKNVNEVYGHIAGDALLRSAADKVLEVAPAGSLCARLGADEFCVALCFEEDDQKAVTNAAERLVQLFSEPFEVSTVAIHVSASVGL